MRNYSPARTLLTEPSVSVAPASSPSTPSAAAPADQPNTLFVSHDGGSNDSLSPPSPEFDNNFSPSMAIIMVVLLTSFFFMGFFSVYLKKCTSDRESNISNAAAARRRETTPEQGLDPAVVESLPMVIYSAVKKTREGKAITECSVCLTEFEDNQPLRLLPKCKHCFHPECIDMWLYTHTTCPLCRRSLLLESSSGSFRWGWGSMRGSRLIRNEDIHGGEPMDLATEGGGIARIDEAGNLSQPKEGVSSVRSSRRGPDLKDRDSRRAHGSSIDSLRPSASLSSSNKGGTSFRSELRRSHSTGHSRVKRALSRASLFLPGSSSIDDHPNDGQPLSSCLPLGASTSAELHRSRSHAMLSGRDMQFEESGVLAQDSSSSRRWNRSFSFKRAFSLRGRSQEAMATSMGELASSSGAHRTFDRLGV